MVDGRHAVCLSLEFRVLSSPHPPPKEIDHDLKGIYMLTLLEGCSSSGVDWNLGWSVHFSGLSTYRRDSFQISVGSRWGNRSSPVIDDMIFFGDPGNFNSSFLCKLVLCLEDDWLVRYDSIDLQNDGTTMPRDPH